MVWLAGDDIGVSTDHGGLAVHAAYAEGDDTAILVVAYDLHDGHLLDARISHGVAGFTTHLGSGIAQAQSDYDGRTTSGTASNLGSPSAPAFTLTWAGSFPPFE